MGISAPPQSAIKSIQRGTATFFGATSYASGLGITISAIDTTKAEARIVRDARTNDQEVAFVTINTATQLQAWRVVSSTAGNQVINWEVVEFF